MPLFRFTCIAYQSATTDSYRLIPNLGVYCRHDNSSTLLSNIIKHPNLWLGFYTSLGYITITSKLPFNPIRLLDTSPRLVPCHMILWFYTWLMLLWLNFITFCHFCQYFFLKKINKTNVCRLNFEMKFACGDDNETPGLIFTIGVG